MLLNLIPIGFNLTLVHFTINIVLDFMLVPIFSSIYRYIVLEILSKGWLAPLKKTKVFPGDVG